jgi:hypothetical protein
MNPVAVLMEMSLNIISKGTVVAENTSTVIEPAIEDAPW